MKNVVIIPTFISACLLLVSSSKDLQRQGKSYLDIFNIVRLNPSSRLAVGVQITVPVSVFMPDLGVFGRQSRSGYSRNHLWSYKPSQSSLPTCPSMGVSVEDYLHLLHIDLVPCQELFICEMSSNPGKYMPISEILLKKLAFNAKWMVNPYFSAIYNSTEYYLFQAAQVGADVNQVCQTKYWDCPVEATSMVNMNLLWGWQILSRLLNIKFTGETDADLTSD